MFEEVSVEVFFEVFVEWMCIINVEIDFIMFIVLIVEQFEIVIDLNESDEYCWVLLDVLFELLYLGMFIIFKCFLMDEFDIVQVMF